MCIIYEKHAHGQIISDISVKRRLHVLRFGQPYSGLALRPVAPWTSPQKDWSPLQLQRRWSSAWWDSQTTNVDEGIKHCATSMDPHILKLIFLRGFDEMYKQKTSPCSRIARDSVSKLDPNTTRPQSRCRVQFPPDSAAETQFLQPQLFGVWKMIAPSSIRDPEKMLSHVIPCHSMSFPFIPYLDIWFNFRYSHDLHWAVPWHSAFAKLLAPRLSPAWWTRRHAAVGAPEAKPMEHHGTTEEN